MLKNIKIKLENDKINRKKAFEEMHAEYWKNFDPIPMVRMDHYAVAEHIVKMTTGACILANHDKRIIALNFANAIIPGGGYAWGANAQEESLCRISGLYYSIKEQKAFYRTNRRHIWADYTDGMIYSENVPVFRNDAGQWLDNPLYCNFMTCPAVNRHEAFMFSKSKLNDIMQKRINKIVSFSQQQKPDIVILGAFGCGAFGNKQDVVLQQFEQAINAYTDGSVKFVFAIP